MTEQRQLERSAIQAHACGIGWNEFWRQRGREVAQAEPYDRHRFARLVAKLLHLVASGDPSGQEPVGQPWEHDDDAAVVVVVSDTATAARCLWPMAADQESTP
jgi:hypothetical protein